MSGETPPTTTAVAAATEGTYTITGTVASSTSASVGGLTVQLVDKGVGPDLPLGTATTDATGRYSISVNISSDTLAARLKTQPDLQVRVSAGATFLAASAVVYNASTDETLNVVLPATVTALPSEFETLTAAIAVNYAGALGALQENGDRSDITYLANKTGWDARAVALAALADQFATVATPAPPAPAPGTPGTPTPGTGPAAPGTPGAAAAPHAITTTAPPPISAPIPTAPAPTPPTPVPAPVAAAPPTLQREFYYALFRAGIPANAASLFRTSAATVQSIWQRACAQGVIPNALAAQIPAAVQTFQSLSASNVLTTPPPAGVSTLQQMLAPALSDPAQQAQFATLYTQHAGDSAGLWSAAQQAFGAAPTQQLQLLGQLYRLTINNAPLVSALHQAEAASAITSTKDLASRGYYDAAKWTPLIGTAVPAGIPGATVDDQRTNYAQLLAAQIRLSFPTAVLAQQVRTGTVPVASHAAGSTAVADFLDANQDQFDIGVEPVEAFIARNKVAGVSPDVVSQVKRIQRAYQLTTDDTSLGVLLRHNLDSAFAITRYDEAAFTRAFQNQLGSAGNAQAVHRRAKQIFTAVLSVATAYANARIAPTLGSPLAVTLGFPPPSNAPSYAAVAYPTLEDLFGSLDYCNCPDCGSILSPAAYLVDLLNFIDQPAPASGFANPQAVLLQRRPDLQYLPLTCPNTNTALPYIDIVNETLEYYVANSLSLANYQGHDTSSDVTSAELLANPQFVDDTAYATLEQTFFPPPLPFNRPLELLRAQLTGLGVALPDAMLALRAGDALNDSTTPASYGWSDILIEQLGISRDERRLFTDSMLQLGDLYGLPNGNALATLQTMSLQDFSRRVGVSYDDIAAILETRFINPDAALLPRVQQLNAPFSTIKTLHDTVSTQQSIAPDFIAALPSNLDATEYGGATAEDYAAVVSWVTDPNIYPRIMGLVTIVDPSGNGDDCSGASLQLRYSNPDNTKNVLSGTDLLKLIRFIRLWRKLQPLPGGGDDSGTIAQTDAMLAALYPPADLPVDPGNTANDTSNRALLDAGFQAFLMRAGFLFQVMNRLSLTANAALPQLLACWAPIGTAGADALYRRMFLTPTLLQQDPGAQTVTVVDPLNAGDVLKTTISGVDIAPHTVVSGENAAAIASAIAAAINGTTTVDPGSGLPLSRRFFASSAAGVVTVKAGFALAGSVSAGATETLAIATASPVSQTATIGGAATPGDELTTTIDGVAIAYTVVAGDTLASIAAAIAAAVNGTTAQDPFSGAPVNSLVVASSAGAVVTLVAANAGAPFTLSCALVPANAAAYTAGPLVPAAYQATIGGPIVVGDTIVTTIDGVGVSYAATAGDTNDATLAGHIAGAIDAAVSPDPSTKLPLKDVVHATNAGDVVTVSPIDPSTGFTLSGSVTKGSESYTTAGPTPASQTLTIAGTLSPGAVLTTTIDNLDVFCAVQSGDTPTTIAARIAAAINNTTSPDPFMNLPLNTVVSAVAAGGVITITAASPTSTFTLSAALSAGAYAAGRKTPPFADNGYGEFLADPAETLFGHEPSLCAAFNFTGAEFASIATALGFSATTQLTLANVSAIFRYGWLAHTLGLSVVEFLTLRTFTGLDPFAPLDPATTAPVEPPIILFVRLLQAIRTAAIQPVQALYLLWNQDISGKSAPPLANITGLATALRAEFAAIEAQFVVQDDPDGSIAQQLMALVYSTSASDFFFGLLNDTVSTSVPFGYAAAALPQPLVDASGGRLAYDDLRKQLTFAGVLDSKTLTALMAAVAVATNDKTDKAAASSGVTLTPATMSNIAPNSVLVLDSSSSQETVVVTATTATTFTTTTAKAHDGTGTPFVIVNDPALGTALASLASASQQAVAPFFATYPELQPLYAAYTASTDPIEAKRATLLNNFLPTLTQKRKQEQALAAVTAAAGTDPSFANALLQNAAVLHGAADTTAPAAIDLTAIETIGLSAEFHLTNDLSSAPDQVTDAVLPDSSESPLPASKGGSAITAVWRGYISAPADGFYDFAIAADPGAGITLQIADAMIAGTTTSGVWHNQTSVSLVSGALVPIVLTVTSAKTTLSVNWKSLGTGWQIIPGDCLYPLNLVARLGDTYVRFLKATSLATALSLTADEIAYLADGWLNSLMNAQAPDLKTSAALATDLGELLQFSAMKAALSRDDSRLLAVMQNPAATLPNGQSALLSLTGWSQLSLNALLTRFFGSAQATALASIDNLWRVYGAYAIVQSCRVAAPTLVAAVTNAPTTTSVAALQSALRAQYAAADWLTVVRPLNDAMRIRQRDALVAYILQRLGDEYAQSLVTGTTTAATITGATQVMLGSATGLAAGMQVQGANIAPGTVVSATAATTVTLSSATLGALPTGSTLTFVPVNAVQIDTADKLYEYFLIDPETQPPVETSRIRLALSTVQLFIERVIRNLEPQVSPTDIDAVRWQWMKRYRVWQANREVFLWPENWLYPELRDDQSPFFEDMMSKLLQSDITDDAATEAYLDYLSNLELVAKLEPCGIYYQESTADADETSYVVARTAGAHRKYYFRQLQGGSWTSWTEAKIDCDDMPITPIVWNGRLFLFWLKILKQSASQPAVGTVSSSTSNIASWNIGDVQSFTSTAAQQTQQSAGVQAVLCWSEFYNGKWQPTKTSDVNRPASLLHDTFGLNGFDVDRNLLRITPILVANDPTTLPPLAIPAGALILAIESPLYTIDVASSFVLYNTHSLPSLLGDIPLNVPMVTKVVTPASCRYLAPVTSYTGAPAAGTFQISYYTLANDGTLSNPYTISLLGYKLTPRYVLPQDGLTDAWDAPFFFEDHRHLFYVTTSEDYVPIAKYSGFGLSIGSLQHVAVTHVIPPLALSNTPHVPIDSSQTFGTNLVGGGSAGAVQQYLGQSNAIRVGLGSGAVVSYQRRAIAPAGSRAIAINSKGSH